MKQQRVHIGILTTAFLSLIWLGFTSFQEPKVNLTPGIVEYHLGFSLNPTHNSGIVSFCVVGENNGKLVYKKFVSKKSWLRQGMGFDLSPANSIGHSLFEEYQLDDCFYKYDSIKDVYSDTIHCFQTKLDDLWALRYKRHPHCPEGCQLTAGMVEFGWAQKNFMPSGAQMRILVKYGVSWINDIFYGPNMFKLFQDVADPDWVDAYKNAE